MAKRKITKILKKVYKMYLTLSLAYTGYEFLKARGLGKEDDRHLIGKAIDRIYGYNVDADEIVMIDDTELHVSYNPYLHLFTNSIGSIACIVNGSTDVYTDARFRSMGKATQYAILCHEMGHEKCNHVAGLTYQFDRIKAVLKGKVLPMELEADEYAVSIVGAYSMAYSLRELATYTKGIAKKEIYLRVKHIESKYGVKTPSFKKGGE